MDLERVAAVIRPRSPWEAVDLGFSMVRAWWRAVYAPWLLAVPPVWLAVLLLGRAKPGWALFALWWLKPAFDRLPLQVASRALFGDLPAARATLRAAHPLRGFLAALTALRLDPARSFYLPVRQLEGARGAAVRERRRVLKGSGDGPAVALTFAALVMELSLFTALVGLVAMAIPETAGPRWEELWDGYLAGGSPLWFHLLIGFGWWLAVSAVEPFYVAGGFALYLNRRTLLEGWDVELAFRRLSRRLLTAEDERLRTRRAAGAGTALVAALAAAALLAAGGPAAAAPVAEPLAAGGPAAAAERGPADAEAPPAHAPEAASDPQRAIAEVLADPVFGGPETVRTWKWRWEPEGDPDPDGDFSSAGSRFGGLLAAAAEVVLWVAAGVGVAVALIYLARSARRRRPPAPAAAAPGPERRLLSGWLDPAAPLPADVAAAALRLLDAGRPLEALSLLYRGALAALDRRPGLSVSESWTEGECLGHLADQLPAAAGGFLRRLTLAWQRAAYAHRRPAEDELRALCGEWPLHFEGAAR